MTLLSNDPNILGRSKWLFRHQEHKNLSIIYNSLGRNIFLVAIAQVYKAVNLFFCFQTEGILVNPKSQNPDIWGNPELKQNPIYLYMAVDPVYTSYNLASKCLKQIP